MREVIVRRLSVTIKMGADERARISDINRRLRGAAPAGGPWTGPVEKARVECTANAAKHD